MIVGPKSFASIGHVAVKVHINLVVSGCDDAVFVVNTSAELIDHLRSISIGRNLRTKNVQSNYLWCKWPALVDIPSGHLGHSSWMPQNRNL